jgi:hypothetical protein
MKQKRPNQWTYGAILERKSDKLLEARVDFLESPVSLDGFGALRMGANKLLKDGTRHGGLLKF